MIDKETFKEFVLNCFFDAKTHNDVIDMLSNMVLATPCTEKGQELTRYIYEVWDEDFKESYESSKTQT